MAAPALKIHRNIVRELRDSWNLERSGACSLETIENHQFPIEMGWDGMDSWIFRGFFNRFGRFYFL